jgi:ornithine cyclodeaminase
MDPVIISGAEVRALLPMAACMDAMTDVLRTLSAGNAVVPLRTVLPIPGSSGLLVTMPAYTGAPRAFGVKVISVFLGNHGTPYDSHQGSVLLFEAEHGSLLAIIDATEVTAIRTAAVSGVATRLLARSDASHLAILGAGTQARTHLDAMRLVRSLRTVRVWSRRLETARRFAECESERHEIEIRAVESARSAVEGADIICTVTSSPTPVLEGAWIAPGTHINAAGASTAATRELDTAAVVRSRLFVDRRESTLAESGDFLIPRAEGALSDDHIRGELGELLLGAVSGRTSGEEVTVFKSLGLAVEDVAAAQRIYEERCRVSGAGGQRRG